MDCKALGHLIETDVVARLINPETGDEWISYAADKLRDLDEDSAFILVSVISKLRSSDIKVTWDLFCEIVYRVHPEALKECNSYIRET